MSDPGPIATPMQDEVLDEEAKRMFESVIRRGKMDRPEEIGRAVSYFRRFEFPKPSTNETRLTYF